MPSRNNDGQKAIELFMGWTSIKKLVIIEKNPVRGYLCANDVFSWVPINEEGWLSDKCTEIRIKDAKTIGKCKQFTNWASDKIKTYRDECERDDYKYDLNGIIDIDDVFIKIISRLFIKYCYNPNFQINRSFQITIKNNKHLFPLVISDEGIIYRPTIDDHIPCSSGGPVCDLKKTRNNFKFFKTFMKTWIHEKSERDLLKKLVLDIILGRLWDSRINLYEENKIYTIYKLIKTIYTRVQYIKCSNGQIYDEFDNFPDNIEHQSLVVSCPFDEDIPEFIGVYNIYLTNNSDSSDIHTDNNALLKYAGPKFVDHDEFFEFGKNHYLNFILWCFDYSPFDIVE